MAQNQPPRQDAKPDATPVRGATPTAKATPQPAKPKPVITDWAMI